MQKGRTAVAIILALTVMIGILGSGEVVHFMVGMEPEDSYKMGEDIMDVWKTILYTIVGALSVFIANGDPNSEKPKKQGKHDDDK